MAQNGTPLPGGGAITDGLSVSAAAQHSSLRDALRAAAETRRGAAGSDVSGTASESPSEEDYDDLASPPAEAMVLRHRRPHTQLRNELQPDQHIPDPAETAENGRQQKLQEKAAPDSKARPPILSLSSSRRPRSDRKLSATIIFEEKNVSTVSLASSVSTNGGPRAPDGETSSGIRYPSDSKSKRSFVVSIDDPKLAEILRSDLQAMREDLEDRKALMNDGDSDSKSATKAMVTTGVDTGSPTTSKSVVKKSPRRRRRRGRFRDFVFTRKFSTFDRQNEAAANSPFHGFFTLFWLAMFLGIVKIAADNWRETGNPLGTNDIMKIMFHHDVIMLLLSDGIMCAMVGMGWLLQLVIYAGYIDWDGAGWVIQNLWQMLFVALFIGWPHLRDWPWSHTVFFTLHGLVMIMKQHSYAFYNGYLSTLYKRRAVLQARLDQLEAVVPIETPSAVEPSAEEAFEGLTGGATHTNGSGKNLMSQAMSTAMANPDILDKVVAALESGGPLDHDQVRVFARILRWEIDGINEDLRGKATTPEKAYPNNLTFKNQYEYIVLPTVVYELEYPRSESINWRYAAEKLVACFGIIFVMIMVSQKFIYPVVMRTVAMKEAGVPLVDRFKEFPWMLSDLVFPFMLEYLMSWYLIWETILNFLAEITYFADRSFYAAWWNSVTWDEFARDWNRPVHLFLLRHVYHSSISALKVNKHTATLITFFLSACIHELVMWCIFKKLRGYLLFLQMCQLPLVALSRTKWLRNRQTLGNVMFWFGIFFGPSILCSLYLIL